MSALFFAALMYVPQFMMKTLGDLAVKAGAGLLPMMGVFAATSFAAGPLYARLGPRRIVSVGAAFLAVGMLLLSRLDPPPRTARSCRGWSSSASGSVSSTPP